MNIPLYKSREDIANNRFYAFVNGAKPTDDYIPVYRLVHINVVYNDTDKYHFESQPPFGARTRWKYTAEDVWNEILETGRNVSTTTDQEAVTDYHSLMALGLGERIIVIDGKAQPAT